MSDLLLTNLEVRSFRRFDSLTIEQFGHVNLIAGKNNAGKSTVLEAINLYANLGSPQVIWEILSSRDELIDRSSPRKTTRRSGSAAVWSLFHGHPPLSRVRDPIQIGPVSSPASTLSVGIDWLDPRTHQSVVHSADETSATRSDGSRSAAIPALTLAIGGMNHAMRLDEDFRLHCRRWSLLAESFVELSTRCIVVGPHGVSPRAMEGMWDSVALTDLEEDVVESMRIMVPEVDDFALLNSELSSGTTVRVKLRGSDQPVPLRSMGDGVQRLFGLAMALVSAKGGILLVDEIENGLHYSALAPVWKFIARIAHRLNVQVFATTHSLDCIREFHKTITEDTALNGVLNRLESKEGQVRSVPFDKQRLQRFISEDIEMR
jgi:hypothetical protein